MNTLTNFEKKDLGYISKILQSRSESLAVAESVTAGLIQARFSLAKDAMMFFQGGITTYNLGQKTKQLDVDPIIAEQSNCVSPAVSNAMAVSVAKHFNSQWGLAVTGYAAPVPQLKVRTCFCHYTVAYQGEIALHGTIESKLKSILRVQHHYVTEIVHQFSALLKSLNSNPFNAGQLSSK